MRKLEIAAGKKTRIVAEPGDWGKLRVELAAAENSENDEQQRSRIALAALAYGLHDQVAKQSIRGENWAKVKAPVGRPRSGKALSNVVRQRRFRLKSR